MRRVENRVFHGKGLKTHNRWWRRQTHNEWPGMAKSWTRSEGGKTCHQWDQQDARHQWLGRENMSLKRIISGEGGGGIVSPVPRAVKCDEIHSAESQFGVYDAPLSVQPRLLPFLYSKVTLVIVGRLEIFLVANYVLVWVFCIIYWIFCF